MQTCEKGKSQRNEEERRDKVEEHSIGKGEVKVRGTKDVPRT